VPAFQADRIIEHCRKHNLWKKHSILHDDDSEDLFWVEDRVEGVTQEEHKELEQLKFQIDALSSPLDSSLSMPLYLILMMLHMNLLGTWPPEAW